MNVFPAGYRVRKAAQVAAFFAMREPYKRINVLKLVKLMYLADREFLTLYDAPILYDKFVSMPHGPVNSVSYNFIGGSLSHHDWDEFLFDRANHFVGLRTRTLSSDELDELSEAEIDVLSVIWQRFGGMSGFELEQWTHDHCAEWEDPQGSSNPIPYERVFKHLHKTNSGMLANAIEEDRRLSTI